MELGWAEMLGHSDIIDIGAPLFVLIDGVGEERMLGFVETNGTSACAKLGNTVIERLEEG